MDDRRAKPFVQVKNGRVTERQWTPEGQLLLREAFELFGEAYFPGAWNGKEWQMRSRLPAEPGPPEKPPNVPPGAEADAQNFELPVYYPVNGKREMMSYEEALRRYEAEKDILFAGWNSLRAAHERFRETAYKFRQAMNAGHVSAAVLEQSGGGTTPVPKSIWASSSADGIIETGTAGFDAGEAYSTYRVRGLVVLPDNEVQRYIRGLTAKAELEAAQELSEKDKEVTVPGVSGSDKPTAAPKVGRPAKYDREGCWVEMCRITYADGLPETQAEMVGMLQDWFISEIETAPTDSKIKKRVSKLFRAIQEADNS